MKKIITLLLTFSLIGGIFIPLHTLLAATTTVTQFEIIAPTTARAGEAIDITVRAIDKDKKVVSNYRGSIIFNTDNIADTVPMPGKSVAFTADDNGEKKFSKGVIFKKAGKQKIYVVDLTDDISGEATLTVDAASANPTTSDQTISIITPENGNRVNGDMVMVSGKTRKNSRVIIKLNGKDLDAVNTDESGIFTKNITGLTQENNLISASLIDGSSTTIATSPEVNFSRIIANSATYGVSISPASTVEASSPITITIDGTPGLREVSISLDNSVILAKEETQGKYIIKTIAPQNPGTYKFPITQKDTLGQTKTTDTPTSLLVIPKTVMAPPIVPEIPPTFKNVKTITASGRVVFEFGVNNPPPSLFNFKIAYGKNADSLSQETVTQGLVQITSPSSPGVYTWYIDSLPPDTYTFKIFGRTQTGALIPGFVSDPIVATIGKIGCTIGNVGTIKVTTDKTKSILSWDTVSGANSYNLYKVSAAGDYVLFQNTKEPTYTLYLSTGAVTYDNFSVKALCDTTTESKEYSSMSKVQSGPGMIALLVIISATLGALLMRRRSI